MRLAIPFLIVLFTASCSRPDAPVSIRFAAVSGGVKIDCSSTPVALSDLRFYVAELAMIRSDGRAEIVHLRGDDALQNERLTLVDLESGDNACTNGTTETNDRVSGLVQGVDYSGVRFTIGVPFDLNHADPLLAEAPLDDSAMHWHWRSGYKFLRAALVGQNTETFLHLGSTGCEGTVGNISACGAPNRVVVELPNFDPATDVVTIDLAQLLPFSPESESESCLSSPAEDACAHAFAALGLPFADEATDKQRVFGVSR